MDDPTAGPRSSAGSFLKVKVIFLFWLLLRDANDGANFRSPTLVRFSDFWLGLRATLSNLTPVLHHMFRLNKRELDSNILFCFLKIIIFNC